MQLSDDDYKLAIYNGLDSAITYQVKEQFWDQLAINNHTEFYEHTIRLLQPLMYMMERGINVDIEGLKTLSSRLEKDINIKQEELNNAVGRELNPQSPKQVKEYFYDELGIPPYKNKDGKPSTDDKALTRIARGTASRSGRPEAKLIQELRGLHKLKGTYIDISFDSDGRFRTACNPRGTTSGRISAGKTIYDTGMNMQNLTPLFKEYLIPDEGCFFIELDKRQAEWVVVAYDSGDANMIDVLERGEDPHVHTAHLMFGVPKDLIIAENKIIGHVTDPVTIQKLREEKIPEIFNYGFVPRIFSMRQAGKKSNHALNYAETYKRFAFENEMPEKDSKYIVTHYHKGYPGIENNYKRTQVKLRKDRTLTNCFGQSRLFLDKWGDDLFKSAYAYIPQSTVGYIINKALIDIYHDTEDAMSEVEQLAQVHDSILFQLPLSLETDELLITIDKLSSYLNPTMEYHNREFTIATDIKMGIDSWGTLEEYDLTNKTQLRSAIDEFKAARGLDNELSRLH